MTSVFGSRWDGAGGNDCEGGIVSADELVVRALARKRFTGEAHTTRPLVGADFLQCFARLLANVFIWVVGQLLERRRRRFCFRSETGQDLHGLATHADLLLLQQGSDR